jgi:hypothetical protein
MSIKSQIIVDNAIFLDLDTFAEQITYEGKTISAVVVIGDSSIKGDTFENRGRASVGSISVSAIDVPDPQTGDEVIINSVKWEMSRIIDSDSAMNKLQIISGESVL